MAMSSSPSATVPKVKHRRPRQVRRDVSPDRTVSTGGGRIDRPEFTQSRSFTRVGSFRAAPRWPNIWRRCLASRWRRRSVEGLLIYYCDEFAARGIG